MKITIISALMLVLSCGVHAHDELEDVQKTTSMQAQIQIYRYHKHSADEPCLASDNFDLLAAAMSKPWGNILSKEQVDEMTQVIRLHTNICEAGHE